MKRKKSVQETPLERADRLASELVKFINKKNNGTKQVGDPTQEKRSIKD